MLLVAALAVVPAILVEQSHASHSVKEAAARQIVDEWRRLMANFPAPFRRAVHTQALVPVPSPLDADPDLAGYVAEPNWAP